MPEGTVTTVQGLPFYTEDTGYCVDATGVLNHKQ
jgi:hypothetical protein